MSSSNNITAPRVPLTDERTGLISREWYRFFLTLFELTGAGQNVMSITDTLVGPPAADPSVLVTVTKALQGTQVGPPPADVTGLTKAVQGLGVAPSTLDTLALLKGLQALSVGPSDGTLLARVAELTKVVQGLQAAPTRFNLSNADLPIPPLRVATVTPITVSASEVAMGVTVVSKLAAPGAVAVTIPSPGNPGARFIVKDGTGDAGVNNITLTPTTGTIDGGATLIVGVNYASVSLVDNGTEWNLV